MLQLCRQVGELLRDASVCVIPTVGGAGWFVPKNSHESRPRNRVPLSSEAKWVHLNVCLKPAGLQVCMHILVGFLLLPLNSLNDWVVERKSGEGTAPWMGGEKKSKASLFSDAQSV